MNAHVVEMETSVHQKVQKLLPWAANGRLPSREQDMVSEHVTGCAQCRDDLQFQRRLQSIPPAQAAAPDMEAALARLMPALKAVPARRRHAMSDLSARLFSGQPRWSAWALAAQLVLIAGMGLMLARQPDTQAQGYRLLGAAAKADANLVVKFRPETSLRELQLVLQRSAARVVDGPTVADAWLLSVPSAKLSAATAALRADPSVEMAEPLHGGAMP